MKKPAAEPISNVFPQANSYPIKAQTPKVNRIHDNHQQIALASIPMKKLLLLALSAFSISAYALPTYEPCTEFAPTIATNPVTLVATTNVGGGALGSLANSSIPNCINLATGGYTAPGGEQWGSLNFSGTGGTGLYKGLDIAVISNETIFTYAALSSLLPATFPGMPASDQAITNLVENPAQPMIWNGTAHAVNPNIVGNSAVLKFSQPITRPTSGTKTVYVSYLLSVVQQGQLGTGNNGRYMAFLSQSNLVEGTGSGGTYTTWASLFNTYNGATASGVHYASHGLLFKAGLTYYIGPCDSAAGKTFSTSTFYQSFNTPCFVVGAYLLNSGANKDTNAVWVNPGLSSFGGANPPLSPIQAYTMSFNKIKRARGSPDLGERHICVNILQSCLVAPFHVCQLGKEQLRVDIF